MIKYLIFIIGILLVLSYFGITLQGIVESPAGQSNLSYVQKGILYVWDNYLAKPLNYLYNDIFIELLWKSFLINLNRVKMGQPLEIEQYAPKINFERAQYQ